MDPVSNELQEWWRKIRVLGLTWSGSCRKGKAIPRRGITNAQSLFRVDEEGNGGEGEAEEEEEEERR